MEPAVNEPVIRQAAECRDLFTDDSPPGLRVTRITTDDAHAHSHIYMESPVFTPDSRRFVFQRLTLEQSDWPKDRRQRQYWLCDIDDGFALRQLTDEPEVIAPAVSPDGRYMYYFLNEQDPTSRRGVSLKRVCLETFRRETLLVMDRPLPGCAAPPSLLYALASVRSDGQMVSTGAFLCDGSQERGEWGVLVCDVTKAKAEVVFSGPTVFNCHVQYARTTDPQRRHDLLIQNNLGAVIDGAGEFLERGRGCVLHVVRDDGTDFRMVPCGGGGGEMAHGHQEWRGDRETVIVGVDQGEHSDAPTRPVIEATPTRATLEDTPIPCRMPGAAEHRNDITRDMDRPQFGHTAFDPTGRYFAGDQRARSEPPEATRLFIGTLDGTDDATLRLQYLLHPRSTYTNDQATHAHPCLSPDAKRLLFNTDFGGMPQIWMVEGFTYPD